MAHVLRGFQYHQCFDVRPVRPSDHVGGPRRRQTGGTKGPQALRNFTSSGVKHGGQEKRQDIQGFPKGSNQAPNYMELHGTDSA